MIYTSAYFCHPDEELETAQDNKMDKIARMILLRKGDKHLDIGCGWGTLVNYWSNKYETAVSTGVTLGRNQTDYGEARSIEMGTNAEARGLEADFGARFLCMDYRDIVTKDNVLTKQGLKYDKITCLEMAEHVGVKNFSSFVSQVYGMLEDDGVFYLQIAGLRRAWQLEDFNWGLFMAKYVFPGADASMPLGWDIDQLESGGFEIQSVETIGIHYSATIKRWYDNWCNPEHEAYIKKTYGERAWREWAWFLGWSVLSPEHGMATAFMIVAHKNTSTFDRKRFMPFYIDK
jgi:cyclopropane fatty-acyl-phospholipid synthase-like methyltransferase